MAARIASSAIPKMAAAPSCFYDTSLSPEVVPTCVLQSCHGLSVAARGSGAGRGAGGVFATQEEDIPVQVKEGGTELGCTIIY